MPFLDDLHEIAPLASIEAVSDIAKGLAALAEVSNDQYSDQKDP